MPCLPKLSSSKQETLIARTNRHHNQLTHSLPVVLSIVRLNQPRNPCGQPHVLKNTRLDTPRNLLGQPHVLQKQYNGLLNWYFNYSKNTTLLGSQMVPSAQCSLQIQFSIPTQSEHLSLFIKPSPSSNLT